MRTVTRVKAHKLMRRGLRQGIRDFERKHRMKQISGMAEVYSKPKQGRPKGMKKKFIWRMKAMMNKNF